MVAKVLTKTGATVQARAMIYKVVVQIVILYGSNSWVVMEVILKVVGGYHYQVDQRIAGMSYWQVGE